jgi:hypothetical protein
MLAREVTKQRRRSLRLAMICSLWGAAAGGAALAMLLGHMNPVAVRVIVYQTTVTSPAPAPPPPPEPPPEPTVAHQIVGTGCAANLSLVGMPPGGAVQDRVAYLRGAAAGGCVIAAYTDYELYISRDDGVTFATALSGYVEELVVAEDGTVYAVVFGEERRLAVLTPDGAVTWRALPMDLDRFTTEGAWLGALGDNTVALTSDRGATWRYLALPAVENPSWVRQDLAIEPDGTLYVVTELDNEDGERGTVRRRGNVRGGAWRTVDTWGPSTQNVILPDHGVATYVNDDDMWWVHRGTGHHKLPKVTDVLADGAVALATTETAVGRLVRGRFQPLYRTETGRLAAVDREGNPLLFVDGNLVRWTEAGGERTLLAGDPQEPY